MGINATFPDGRSRCSFFRPPSSEDDNLYNDKEGFPHPTFRAVE